MDDGCDTNGSDAFQNILFEKLKNSSRKCGGSNIHLSIVSLDFRLYIGIFLAQTYACNTTGSC